MTIRSTRLAAANLPVDTYQVVYTSPDGWRTIFKSLTGNVFATGLTGFELFAQTADQVTTAYMLFLTSLTGTVISWDGWVVLHPGDTISARAAGVGASIWLSGTLLRLTGAEPLAAIAPPTPGAPGAS